MKAFICGFLFMLAWAVNLPASLATETINPEKLPGKFFFVGQWEDMTTGVASRPANMNAQREIYVASANGLRRQTLIPNYNDVYELYWYSDLKKLGLKLINSTLHPHDFVEFDLSNWNGGEIDRLAAKQSLPDDFPTPYYYPEYRTLPNGKTEPIPDSRNYTTRVTFSPDGRKVAGISDGHICVTDINGAQPAKCVKDQEACSHNPPVWSPDGKQIVFVGPTTDDRYACNLMELFIADADTQNVRQLTDVPGDKYTDMSVVKEGVEVAYFHKSHHPAWSPDGQWIAFFSTRGVAKIRPDGTGFHVIAKNAHYPTWSPDSKMIAYTAARGDRPENYRYGIFVSWADGTGETWITKDLEMLRENNQFLFVYEDLNWAE